MTPTDQGSIVGRHVRLGGFTPPTYDLIAQLVEFEWGHPKLSHARPMVIPIEHAAALFFVLKAAPESSFPNGKWATIQHLEALIESAAFDKEHHGS